VQREPAVADGGAAPGQQRVRPVLHVIRNAAVRLSSDGGRAEFIFMSMPRKDLVVLQVYDSNNGRSAVPWFRPPWTPRIKRQPAHISEPRIV